MAFAGINGNMGINRLGDPSIIFKRKFRWTLALSPLCGTGDIDPWFVKVAARPSMTLEATQINFLNGVGWIPGKAVYETINVTFLDVAPKEPASMNLYKWLGAVFQFWSPNRKMGSSASQYAASGNLVMYDGCGSPIEQWQFADLWPTSIKFGELDYSSMDIATVELTLRYSQFQYVPMCPGFNFTQCCAGC